MLVDSNQKMLSMPELIAIGARMSGEKMSQKRLETYLQYEFALPNVFKCREGNTIFIVHSTHIPGVGYARTINADTAPNYVHNLITFAKAAYQAGYDNVVANFKDKRILRAFHIIATMNPPDMGFAVQNTKDGGHQVTIQCGKPRGDANGLRS